MKYLLVVILSLILIFPVTVLALNTDSHLVTVTVVEINEIAVIGGGITLTINSAVAGSEPTPVTDTTCDLCWTTNGTGKKITVKTNQGSPTFTLTVLPTSISALGGGTAVGAPVTLSTTDIDFITAISIVAASCDLEYTASATAAQGTGSEVHTVTYTITAG